MARNWLELNAGRRRALADELYVSINARHYITFNRKTFKDLNEPEAFVLLFDPETDTIGLRPASKATLNAFRVQPKGVSGHRYVNALALGRKHDIQIEGTQRFVTAAIEEGILVLDLRNRVRVEGPKWGPNRKRPRKKRG